MNATRRLILLRHAHAESAAWGEDDAERPLSARGIEEADSAGHWLAEQAPPARIICSPARRTRQTLERVTARLGVIETDYDARVYGATPGELIDIIDGHAGPGDLLLVGHNPGLESLVALLATGRSSDHRGMPPAGVAVLTLPEEGELEPGVASLAAFWSP